MPKPRASRESSVWLLPKGHAAELGKVFGLFRLHGVHSDDPGLMVTNRLEGWTVVHKPGSWLTEYVDADGVPRITVLTERRWSVSKGKMENHSYISSINTEGYDPRKK